MVKALHVTFIKLQKKKEIVSSLSVIGTILSVFIKSVICSTQNHKSRLIFSRQKQMSNILARNEKLCGCSISLLDLCGCYYFQCLFPIYIIFSIKNDISHQPDISSESIDKITALALCLTETEFPITDVKVVKVV